MTIQKAVLVVGSPRGGRSNSYSLGSYLMGRLEDRRIRTSSWTTPEILRSEATTIEFLDDLDDSDLLVLAFPLYFDSLPAIDIRLLETIASHQRGSEEEKGFMAIVNSGFPEAGQSEIALLICRQFAGQANLRWLGGLVLGGGMALGGRPLRDLRGMARNITKALDLAAAELARGKPVPMEAKRRMGLPVAPKFLFIRMGNRMWRKLATSNHVNVDEAPHR